MVLLPCLPPIRTSLPNLKEALEQGKLGIIKYILHWVLFVMAFPYLVVYTWTIPNCSKNRKWYVVATAFSMAIFWIAVISFGMVTLVARVGCILNIGEFTMGLVVVAIGTSIPVSQPLSFCTNSPPPPGCYKLHSSGQGWVWRHGSVQCHRLQCV